MASADFPKAIAYALFCVDQQDLTLKPKQEEARVHLDDRRDVLAWLSTGNGKSLYYQQLLFMSDLVEAVQPS